MGNCTGRVPRAEHDPAVRRILYDFPDTPSKLVYALTVIRDLAVNVLGGKVSPLKAVNRPEVALSTVTQSRLSRNALDPVTVPDLDAPAREQGRVCRADDEPEQFLDDSA
jgi:hypothetical protein